LIVRARDLPWQTQVAILAGGALGVGFVYLWVRYGDVNKAAGAIAGTATRAIVGAVSGVASGVDEILTPDDPVHGFLKWPQSGELIDDPAVVRWIIDVHGYITAGKWATLSTLYSASALPAGSGWPPPIGALFYTLQTNGE
jgi:hypothetical protein